MYSRIGEGSSEVYDVPFGAREGVRVCKEGYSHWVDTLLDQAAAPFRAHEIRMSSYFWRRIGQA